MQPHSLHARRASHCVGVLVANQRQANSRCSANTAKRGRDDSSVGVDAFRAGAAPHRDGLSTARAGLIVAGELCGNGTEQGNRTLAMISPLYRVPDETAAPRSEKNIEKNFSGRLRRINIRLS
jgi:hypothetical protein